MQKKPQKTLVTSKLFCKGYILSFFLLLLSVFCGWKRTETYQRLASGKHRQVDKLDVSAITTKHKVSVRAASFIVLFTLIYWSCLRWVNKLLSISCRIPAMSLFKFNVKSTIKANVIHLPSLNFSYQLYVGRLSYHRNEWQYTTLKTTNVNFRY